MPRAEYRHRFDYLCERLSERSACKLMVELLSLAHDRACEAQLAVILSEDLAGYRLSAIKHLWEKFAERSDKEGWTAVFGMVR